MSNKLWFEFPSELQEPFYLLEFSIKRDKSRNRNHSIGNLKKWFVSSRMMRHTECIKREQSTG